MTEIITNQVDVLTLVDHVQVASRLWRRGKVPNVLNTLSLAALVEQFGQYSLLVIKTNLT